MSNARMNNLVAKELSDALARCKTNGVDEQSMRTGLLTITIANFVNRIGMDNTIALFQELPGQIASGIFDRYIDPNTNTPRATPYASPPAPAAPPPSPQQQPYPPAQHPYPPQHPPYPPAPGPQMPPPTYNNPTMPTNFIQPHPGPPQQAGPSGHPAPPSSASRRRLVD